MGHGGLLAGPASGLGFRRGWRAGWLCFPRSQGGSAPAVVATAEAQAGISLPQASPLAMMESRISPSLQFPTRKTGTAPGWQTGEANRVALGTPRSDPGVEEPCGLAPAAGRGSAGPRGPVGPSSPRLFLPGAELTGQASGPTCQLFLPGRRPRDEGVWISLCGRL